MILTSLVVSPQRRTLDGMEPPPLTADVLVIGFGKGGKTAAHALTDAGRRVVLVERSANMYGGTCPNVGCVPTKMLVHYSNPSASRTTRSSSSPTRSPASAR